MAAAPFRSLGALAASALSGHLHHRRQLLIASGQDCGQIALALLPPRASWPPPGRRGRLKAGLPKCGATRGRLIDHRLTKSNACLSAAQRRSAVFSPYCPLPDASDLHPQMLKSAGELFYDCNQSGEQNIIFSVVTYQFKKRRRYTAILSFLWIHYFHDHFLFTDFESLDAAYGHES